MDQKKKIALVAHDNRKKDLVEWAEFNADRLAGHTIICTGTTGKLVEEVLNRNTWLHEKIEVTKLKSGPLGGDQQIGALISEGKIDIMIFLWDPMEAQPHDVDVKALLRISAVYNIPVACNRSTADFIISSALFDGRYDPILKDYSTYLTRSVHLM